MGTRGAWFLTIVILAVAAAVQLAMGRNPICTCGTVDLWVGARDSPKTSQMLADWYSLSHIVHGLLFYAVLGLLARRCPIEWRFIAALLAEASWEVIENTPMVIDRYRATTAALGYTGDSVLNSLSDIVMMAAGFLAARKLPVWTAVTLLFVLEVTSLFAIRDNLTLNVWQLIAPNTTLQRWQANG
jgi:hypothetical protein